MYTVHIQFAQGGLLCSYTSTTAAARPSTTRYTARSRTPYCPDRWPRARRCPSIRALAKDLRISVITTKRAYDELENEGFIYTLPGKGCFVAERSTELLREENLRKIESHMQEIRWLANACRLTEQELDDMWRLQKEEAE